MQYNYLGMNYYNRDSSHLKIKLTEYFKASALSPKQKVQNVKSTENRDVNGMFIHVMDINIFVYRNCGYLSSACSVTHLFNFYLCLFLCK